MKSQTRSKAIRKLFLSVEQGEKLTVSAPAVYRDMADHLLVNFSSAVESFASISRERNDDPSLPCAI